MGQIGRLQYALQLGSHQVVQQPTSRSQFASREPVKISLKENLIVVQKTRFVPLLLLFLCLTAVLAMTANGQQLANQGISVFVDASDGSYRISTPGGTAIFSSGIGAQLDHQ